MAFSTVPFWLSTELQIQVIQERTGKYRDIWNEIYRYYVCIYKLKKLKHILSFLFHRIACSTKRWPEVYLQLFLYFKKKKKKRGISVSSETTFRGEKKAKDTLKWDLYLAFRARLLPSIIFLFSCTKGLSVVVQVWFVPCISVRLRVWIQSINKKKGARGKLKPCCCLKCSILSAVLPQGRNVCPLFLHSFPALSPVSYSCLHFLLLLLWPSHFSYFLKEFFLSAVPKCLQVFPASLRYLRSP